MTARRAATAYVGLLISALAISGCTNGTATADHPNGCQAWNEGPPVPTHPSAGASPATFTAYLRQPFQTVLPTATSPNRAIADDPRTLKFLWLTHKANGQTYTGFEAVGVGTTTVRVESLATAGRPAATLRLTVTVRCHTH